MSRVAGLMARQLTTRPLYLRAVSLYLTVVVLLSFGLLLSSLVSIERNRRILGQFSVANLDVSTQLVAVELERHLWQLAERCLQEPGLAVLGDLRATGGRDPARSWSELAAVAARHPVADRYFALDPAGLDPGIVTKHLRPIVLRIGAADAGDPDPLADASLARAFQRTFRAQKATRGAVDARWFSAGGENWQTFYTLVPGTSGAASIVGISVDVEWVTQELLPRCRSEVLGSDTFVMPLLTVVRPASDPEPDGVPALRVPFKRVFGFLELQVPAALARATEQTARREMLFAAGSALMVTIVVVLGLVLLLRVSGEVRLVQLRSEFVQGVSHELKTPLTLIRLYGDTLLEGGDFSEEERRTCYQVIVRESERLGRLIENVLDFTRGERGQVRHELVEGDLAAVFSQVVETYGKFLALHGFMLRVVQPESVPPVRFNAEEVTQALLNLMDNARKYSGESNTITVRLWYEDEKVIIEVEDHGIGIPAAEQQAIFRQFYRAHPRGETGGCGLGLFLVSNTMEAHGGAVEVQSDVGRGSRFRLIFPVSRPVPQSDEQLARQPLLARFLGGSELYAQDPDRRGSRRPR